MDRRTNADGAAAEPLLPVRMPGDNATAVAQDASPPRLREQYLKQLGYTPLIFRQVKRFGSFIASLSPMHKRERGKPTDGFEQLESDAFPYHQSIIPSKGSIRGSVFNLAGATLGAGALTLPYAVAVSGVGFAVAQLVLAALLTVYTIRLLIRAGDLTNLKSYEDLSLFCFGKKAAIFVEVNILVFCFGIAVAYLVTLGDIIEPLGVLYFGAESLLAQRWVNVFSIYTELQRPCIRRMNKVVDRATAVSFMVYLVIGVVAYLAFGPALVEPQYKGNILLSFPLSDTLIAVSRAAITFTVSVAFPLNIFPCRFTIDMMFFAYSQDSLARHVVVTSSLVLLALLLAIFCPSINVVFGIIGGTCSTVVCFCLPAAFILKLEDGPLLGPKKLGSVLLFVGAVIIGTIGTGVTVWSTVY
ncbi:hypothetical protein PybrP1_002619 [[Pythium] brassicae (nom. inval.)]|nr:hypothetical protein PybrP1_002619 [[Pythium] brassicae (nom. inval.)]